ncbi:hypothetical protein [Shinella sp.]|uniref:hypothetical protein n=1 Tax=Shinella sp. TaxID=1870904 RepID=UPI0040371EB3
MLKSQNANGPSLVDVLAFCCLESFDDVCRVERIASSRMAHLRGWVGWRVSNVAIAEDADNLLRFTVNAEPVGPGYREPITLEFLTGATDRLSMRFGALLRACGIVDRIEDDRELVGRYFSTRNSGETARDFGPLTRALVA